MDQRKLRKLFQGVKDMGLVPPKAKTIPTLFVSSSNLCLAWEFSVLELWSRGCAVATQYDKPGDPLSRDATMIIEVTDPLSEPRLYKGFPGGLIDLWKYRQEVVEGAHDHWIDLDDKLKWQYTYHQRLRDYLVSSQSIPHNTQVSWRFDQIFEYVIPSLVSAPYTRRAQAVTWRVDIDTEIDDPPCLQRLWFRILNGKLHMNSHWRSRDAFKAAYMNMFAMIELQKMVAEKVSQLRGEKIEVGPYKDISDSYHVYGFDFSNEKLPMSFQGWLDWLSKHLEGGIDERAWVTEFALENFDFINEAEKQLAEEVEKEKQE